MENKKRTQRTPAQIIAETEARLEKLRVKQAKAEAQDNPAVAKLVSERNDVQKQYREAKKILGDGPQSASSRLASHEEWITKINFLKMDAESAVTETQDRLAKIDEQIAQVVASLTAN
jgi:capsule polysaccharide export protein KpsE/RkpR